MKIKAKEWEFKKIEAVLIKLGIPYDAKKLYRYINMRINEYILYDRAVWYFGRINNIRLESFMDARIFENEDEIGAVHRQIKQHFWENENDDTYVEFDMPLEKLFELKNFTPFYEDNEIGNRRKTVHPSKRELVKKLDELKIPYIPEFIKELTKDELLEMIETFEYKY